MNHELKVVITGGTGFVGSHLMGPLRARGASIVVLSRRPSGRGHEGGGSQIVGYDPMRGPSFSRELAGADVVIHLAGEPFVGVRWTPERKRRFDESRVGGTQAMVAALNALAPKERPRLLITSSAVGYYGDRPPSDELDESSAGGQGYAAELCRAWEDAAIPASELGIRVVVARIGIVLGADGGILAKMVPPFRIGLGGAIGHGRQVISWIHHEDVAGIFLRAIDDESLRGAVNITAPHPVDMNELARTIGRVLGRPSFMRVPEAGLRLAFGEGAGPLLSGQRVLPKMAETHGYHHRFPHLLDALKEILASESHGRVRQ